MGSLKTAAIAAILLPAAAAAGQDGPVSREVSWTIGATTVTATLTLPPGAGPFPAALFVAGSGPTDRDWTGPLIPGKNGTPPLLAADLAAAGFASLRFDKRFLGPHGPANLAALGGKLSFKTHLEEVDSAAAYLRGRKDIYPDRLFALTNSEGAIHALRCQSVGSCAFAGLVLTAPPGRPLKDVMRWQLAKQAAALPDPAGFMARYDALMAKFFAGLPFAPDPQLPPAVNQLVASLYANLPFTRELLPADAPALAAKCPPAGMLAVFGGKDIQVDRKLDGERYEALGREGLEIAFAPAADHALKHEPRPKEQLSPANVSYNAPGRVLDPEVSKLITAWLQKAAAAYK